MARRQFSSSVTALLLAAPGCSPPDVPRIAMCAEAELEDGTVSPTGSTTFDSSLASVVAEDARRLPVDNGGGQCGDASQRFEFELADSSNRRHWFAFSLFSDGDFERPDVPDFDGTNISAQVQVQFGFPDTGSVHVNDGLGLLLAAEMNGSNQPHELGGLTLQLGDETGPTVDAPCGVDHYHSLRVESGGSVVQVPTNSSEVLALQEGDILVRNLRSSRTSPDLFGCPPDSGGGDTINWFGRRP